MDYELSYKVFGEHAILVEWPKKITESILGDVLKYKEQIKMLDKTNIHEVRSAYQSLLIVYNTAISFENEIEILKHIYNSESKQTIKISNTWRIPVCYDDAFGLDLKTISESNNISKANIVKRHSEVTYTVYFIGFLPGFLYLGGLNETLTMPRKLTPRPRVEKGSVAIGGNQTGIYPSESPGGWHIIGKTPIDFFNPNTETPCFAQSGDSIKFYPITFQEFEDTKILVDANVYQIESEEHDD